MADEPLNPIDGATESAKEAAPKRTGEKNWLREIA
jgi:hypothetical protein